MDDFLGHSRWLTHTKISENGKASSVVGFTSLQSFKKLKKNLSHNVDRLFFASGSKLRVFRDYLIVGKWEEEEEVVR